MDRAQLRARQRCYEDGHKQRLYYHCGDASRGTPLKLRGMARAMAAYSAWRTDGEMARRHGEVVLRVEVGPRRETRKHQSAEMTMAQFLACGPGFASFCGSERFIRWSARTVAVARPAHCRRNLRSRCDSPARGGRPQQQTTGPSALTTPCRPYRTKRCWRCCMCRLWHGAAWVVRTRCSCTCG